MIQIFYGYGKGKTSALNGFAVRSHGANLKVGVFRFLKGRHTSEDDVLRKIGIVVKQIHSSEKFVIEMSKEEKEHAKLVVKQGIECIKNSINDYDVILLDEIIDLLASSVDLIAEAELINFIESIPKEKEVVMSGHIKVNKLFEKADLITHFEKEKHYFDKGVKARKGIEF